MQQTRWLLSFINGSLKTYRIPGLIWILILSINSLIPLNAQAVDPVLSIRQLKEGYLLVRMPSFKGKIDTLKAMITRTSDHSSKARLEKLLHEATQERDTLMADYTRAFKEFYKFSKSGYYYDYEGLDLNITTIHDMDGSLLHREEISMNPVFYLFFERTGDGRLDALVIHDAEGLIIPSPFPNNFMRGGINFLFLKISGKKFASWRIDKMNKKLNKFWKAVA
ncbi:MAG: hypothetical protein ABIQ02_14850 [Saprospiraceae bacterium]